MTINNVAIGYQFVTKGLLELALTHRSANGNNNNERLEFIGDSILGQVISLELYRQFPHANEGQLSRLRSILVRGETLASVAQELDLAANLRLGAGEIKAGGHKRQSILADTLEAIIGAIYLDSDFETTRQVVLTWFMERLIHLDPESVIKDAKSRLQEWLQSRGNPLPMYRIVEQSGPAHNQSFVVVCEIEDLDMAVQGSGSSRRIAEQEAAKSVLLSLDILT